MVKTVWFVRHGHRMDMVDKEGVAASEYPLDPSLSPEGMEQAKKLGQRLKDESIERIYSSPFHRCMQTANGPAQALGVPVLPEEGLSEWLNPKWFPDVPVLRSNKDPDDAIRIDPGYESVGSARFPETYDELKARVAVAARQLVEVDAAEILIVGHGASVYAAIHALEIANVDDACEMCHLYKAVRNGDDWIIEINGDGSHL